MDPSEDGGDPVPFSCPSPAADVSQERTKTTHGHQALGERQQNGPYGTVHDPIATIPEATEKAGLSIGTSPEPISRKRSSKPFEAGTVADSDQAFSLPTQPSMVIPTQSSATSANASSIDPLSQHIFMRTNTDPYRSLKFRPYTTRPDSPVTDANSPITDSAARYSLADSDLGKEKKKGFLGRLGMRGSRKKDGGISHNSEFDENLTDGSNALVFSSIVDSAGFIPHHKEPPRYIRVKSHHKKVKEFDRMFLAQELIGTRPHESATDAKLPHVTVSTASQGRRKTATGGAIWATEFSMDGKYLAAGGRDHIVRVWAVISTAEDRRAQEEQGAQNHELREFLSAPVFLEKPVQEFKGHMGEILDLSWSKNSFLLSTSMDKTVRLWHISRQECLCAFKHKELVSKVAFHPRDDRFFLAGCLDTTLRLWSIPDKSIAFSSQFNDMITAVAFSPDGNMAIAGLLNGFCYLLETEGLKPLTQIHVRSSRGRNAKGSKITGIVTMTPPHGKSTDAIVLITSTDARIRIYNLRNKTLDAKLKGHEHASSQLFANFSDDGKYVISGSENRKAFIWSVSPTDSMTKDKYPCEVFDAHSDIVTTALFAPTKTKQLLGGSGDPVYDLCNPPPITLMSLEEARASHSVTSDYTAHPGSEAGAAASPVPSKSRAEESPGYISRSTHHDGNIIVTSDDTGIIKVFRQDCAATKRKHESWETGSSFSRRLGASSSLPGIGGSIITRTSFSSAAHSRRGSVPQPPPTHPSVGSPTGAHSSLAQTGTNSDRILSWRQGIEGNGSRPGSFAGSSIASPRTERSISPSKTAYSPLAGLSSEARKQFHTATINSPLSSNYPVVQPAKSSQYRRPVPDLTEPRQLSTSTDRLPPSSQAPTSHNPLSSINPPAQNEDQNLIVAPTKDKPQFTRNRADPGVKELGTIGQPVPSLTFKSTGGDDNLRLDPAGASYSFWNLNKWKPIMGLRASLGGGSGHTDSSTSGSHSVHLVGSWASSADLQSAEDKIGKHNTQSKTKGDTNGQRSFSSGMAPNSPLSQSEQASASDNGQAPQQQQPQKTSLYDSDTEEPKSVKAMESVGEGGSDSTCHSRGRAVASGLPAHITPAILVTDIQNCSQGGSRSDQNHLGLQSRSHSPYARSGSIVSRLSSEMTSSDDGIDNDGVEMQCTKCGGQEFKARRVGGMQHLHCSSCGKVVEDTVGL